jgi:hypothetical protein
MCLLSFSFSWLNDWSGLFLIIIGMHYCIMLFKVPVFSTFMSILFISFSNLLYGVYNTKHMLYADLSFFCLASGYALSSVEGRVSMEFFDLSESAQSKKYVFCTLHRLQ